MIPQLHVGSSVRITNLVGEEEGTILGINRDPASGQTFYSVAHADGTVSTYPAEKTRIGFKGGTGPEAEAAREALVARYHEINYDLIVEILRNRWGVANAHVQQTGGGCATIYAGESYTDAEGDWRFPAVGGPGTFGWGKGPSMGSTGEFYIGMDDDGESEAISPSPDATEEDIALLLAAQTYVRDILNDIKECVATGQIPADVTCFSDLHDHVDANEFLLDAHVSYDSSDLHHGLDLVNAVTDLIDAQIRAGALRNA